MAVAATSFPRGRKTKSLGQKVAAPVAASGEALFGKRGLTAAAEEQPKKKAKNAATQAKSNKASATDEVKDNKAILITYKNLHKGMLLLGCVRQITDGQDLMISLPNKLNGTVALSECSDEFYEYHRKHGKVTSQPNDDKEQLQPLSALFTIGQFVPCVVLATAKVAKHKQIHLSLRTSLVHAELSPSSVSKGTALHATVSSVEDHGVIVNVGVRGVHAFVPRNEITTLVHKGQHLFVSVLSMNSHTKTATVTAHRSHVVKVVTRGDSYTLKQLVPGMLLNVRVTDILENGLSVTFLTYFTATVEQNHMSFPCERGWQESYRKGMKARARIIGIDYITKKITLSMAPHVVHLLVPESPFLVGDIVEKATIERIDAGIGMLLSLKSKIDDTNMEDTSETKESTTNIRWKAFAPGYVHISKASDNRVDKLEKKFSVGLAIKCRVLSFCPFDAVASVSCAERSVSQVVLRHKDLVSGTKVNGKILSVESWGLLMEISEGVRGIVTPQHMPPYLLNKKANNGKYKVGKTASARVLHVDLSASKTFLTMKAGLLASELRVLSSFEEATIGQIAHGFITKIGEYGVIVTFYNNVYGLVPLAVLQQAGIVNLEEAYVVGQVVKARVTRCDPVRKRLMLSFDTTPNSSGNKITLTPIAGDLVGTTIANVKITDIEATSWRVETQDGMVGVLPFVQLTDFPRDTSLVDKIVQHFSAGDVIAEPLLIVSQEPDGSLMLSKKPLLLEYASCKATLPRTFEDVEENTVLIGYVTSVNVSKGVFVKFLNNLVALAPKAYLKDRFVAQVDDKMFEIGETVTCFVEKVDKEKKQFVVGFRPSNFITSVKSTNKARPAYFQAYLREQAFVGNMFSVIKAPFKLGTIELAEFIGVRPYGAVFALEKTDKTFTVLVPSVTEKTNNWTDGDTVKLLLTDYDLNKNIYYGATDEALVLSGSKKPHSQTQRVKSGEKIAAKVLAVSCTEKYAVVSFPDCKNTGLLQFGVVQLCDFWCPSQTSGKVEIEVGATIECHVVQSLLTSGFNSTPFDGLVLLALEEKNLAAKSKVVSRKLTSKLPKYTQEDLVLGCMLTGMITGISENFMDIRVETHKKVGKVRTMVSIVDVDEVEVDSGHAHPFDRYSVNSTISGRIIAVSAKGANKLKPVDKDNPAKFVALQLSLRSEDTAGDEKVNDVHRFVRPDWLEGSSGRALLKEGTLVDGVISKQTADGLNVKLSGSVTGTLSCVEVSNDVNILRAFRSTFPVGKRVKCYVLQVETEKKLVELSLIHSSLTEQKTSLKIGIIVNGVISTKKSTIRPPSIMVQLGAHIFGRVCITELLNDWKNNMLELPQFAAGTVVRCVVLSTRNNHIDLSLREDALQNPIEYAKKTEEPAQHNVGDLIPAIVATTTTNGCFVRVDRHTTARVLLRDLSDDFVQDPQSQFFSGKLVAGRVIKKSDRGLELSLKASVVSDDVSTFKLSDLKEGLTVKGTITKVQSYGVFVRIEKTTISGLCHISQVADEKVTQPLDQIFSEGDYVKAKVLNIEDRRVSFGLKPSYFEGDESSSEDESDDDEEEADSDLKNKAEPMDVDEEKVLSTRSVKNASDVDTKFDVSGDTGSSENEDASSVAPVEFSWDGFSNVLSAKKELKDEEDSCDEKEKNDEDATNPSKSSKTKCQQSDEWVNLREKALASNEEVAQSANDFERLLAVSPQNSYLWIQYMAFHVALTEIDLARDVAIRATSAVSFRDEKEKMNVWVAYLNLEHDFGDDASFLRVFKSALQVNHPKRLYLHLVDLYIRAEEHEDVKQTLATMQKKFRTSKQAWIRSLQYLIGCSKFMEAAEVLQHSLKSLAAHKHLPVILKYGQLLYEHNELDKARTIFEGILANYPKRMDLWNVYLDKEIKFGDLSLARALFERLLAMEFSAKKMKSLFKKYLLFEQEQGNDMQVEHVRQLAKDFVANAAV
ncbi:rrna biogenesis protein rrp5 [Plasmopara halstedii]|uniref:rRNA biogenesis protein RRP5 n=1 Tax=Plasmopara halstedii TaxID=4781 RepID=A0A0P1AGR8_PLAHL|nr:rrna biogenesis protein rrp5 [Plasmopara halstedii]CEG39975.1 rrna biogenesis protein rrp5 [Plasmopara halstedii]|eukprot:XP_024576344.1 rrna biogenesis protein rrp5 [Plasmopara halstedii]